MNQAFPTAGDIPLVTMASLKGCWRRNWIRREGGKVDAETRVWWVQGDLFYADLRIPPGRPSFEGVDCLGKCSVIHQRWLASQQGFAGRLGKLGAAFHWERELDFQPPSGGRDVGHLHFVNEKCGIMLEEGVKEPYVEEWVRTGEASDSLVLKMETTEANERGLLIAVGEHFVMAIDRRPKLRQAESLAVLLETFSEKDQIGLLDMEISHGQRIGNPDEWIITESTFPWRERRRAFETIPFTLWS